MRCWNLRCEIALLCGALAGTIFPGRAPRKRDEPPSDWHATMARLVFGRRQTDPRPGLRDRVRAWHGRRPAGFFESQARTVARTSESVSCKEGL